MGIVSACVVYFLSWWLALFVVLPWGNHPETQPDEGNVASAPANPRLLPKFLVTSVIAAIMLLGVYLLIQSNTIDFYKAAAQMAQEDFGQ